MVLYRLCILDFNLIKKKYTTLNLKDFEKEKVRLNSCENEYISHKIYLIYPIFVFTKINEAISFIIHLYLTKKQR